MENNNIFDLVEEMNKNKQPSVSIKKDMNDIFSMLDEIKKDNNISVDEVRKAVNNDYASYTSKLNDVYSADTQLVKKPSIPDHIDNFDTYSQCVLAYIMAVDYGDGNSREYVEGHKAALVKYYNQVRNNPKDIYVVEGQINDEINSYESKSTLKDKGYYDGLFYVLRVLKKSKTSLINKVNVRLKEKIG